MQAWISVPEMGGSSNGLPRDAGEEGGQGGRGGGGGGEGGKEERGRLRRTGYVRGTEGKPEELERKLGELEELNP